MKVLSGSLAVYLENLTVSEHPDVFSEHKVETHLMLGCPPHTLQSTYGATRTGFNHLCRLQGRSSSFLLLVLFYFFLTEISFFRGIPTDGHHRHRPQHQHHHRRAVGPARTAGIQPAYLAGRFTVSISTLFLFKITLKYTKVHVGGVHPR